MKKLLLLLFISLSFLPARGQAIEWVKVQGEFRPQIVSDGVDLLSTGVAQVPEIFGNQTFSEALYLAKHDSSGNLKWAREIKGTLHNLPGSTSEATLTTDLNKNVYLAGIYHDSLFIDSLIFKSTFRGSNFFLTKFNSAGQLLWAKTSDSLGFYGPIQFRITTDGLDNVYAAANEGGMGIGNQLINPTGPGGYLIKFDSNGNLLWGKSNITPFGPTTVSRVQLKGGSGQEVYLMAFTLTHHPSMIYIKKFGPTGTELYSSQLITGGRSWPPPTITLDAADNLYLYGDTYYDVAFGGVFLPNSANGPDDMFLAKMDPAGNWKWAKHLPFGKITNMDYTVMASETGNRLSIARSYFNGHTNFGINYIAKLDTAGNIINSIVTNSGTYNPQHSSIKVWGIATDATGESYIAGGIGGNVALGSSIYTAPNLISGHPSAGFIARANRTYNTISGSLFIDANANGIKDSGEVPFKNGLITINAGQFVTTSDTAGNYKIYLPLGTYQLSLVPGPNYTFNPQNHTVSLTAGNQHTIRDFALAPVPNRTDVQIAVTALTPARPGFPLRYRLTFKNQGTTTLSDSIFFKYDNTKLTYNSASVIPGVNQGNQGNQLQWRYQNLQPNETRNIDLNFTSLPSAPLNTFVQTSGLIRPLVADVFTRNNYDTLLHHITGAYDPNDKQVNKTVLTPAAVAKGALLDYVIRFQNTGTDTAFTVIVRDSISSNLAIPSFEMLSASHPYSYRIIENGIVEWRFDNILLPDSNRNEPASHGFIRYRIKPFATLKNGDKISSRAAIYFDYNEPIYTNPALTRITEPKILRPDFYLYPNPTQNYVIIAADLKMQSSATIRLVNMLGQQISETILPATHDQLHYKLPLNNLPKGVYVVQLETEVGRQTQRLVIQ